MSKRKVQTGPVVLPSGAQLIVADDKADARLMLKSLDLVCALWDIHELMCKIYNHAERIDGWDAMNKDMAFEYIRTEINRILEDNDVDLSELMR